MSENPARVEAVRNAWLDGFGSSVEGFNGEYGADAADVGKLADAYMAALADAPPDASASAGKPIAPSAAVEGLTREGVAREVEQSVNGYCSAETATRRILALAQPPARGWREWSDDVPDGRCLVWIDYPHFTEPQKATVCHYPDGEAFVRVDHSPSTWEPTHWMPMPAAPAKPGGEQ